MTLEQLRIFAAVAEALHFTRAAETLRLSQPAVSAAVAALEAEHGVRLFDRIGRRVERTAAGTLLWAEARAILRKVEETGTMMAELSGLTRGTLRLVASQTVGKSLAGAPAGPLRRRPSRHPRRSVHRQHRGCGRGRARWAGRVGHRRGGGRRPGPDE